MPSNKLPVFMKTVSFICTWDIFSWLIVEKMCFYYAFIPFSFEPAVLTLVLPYFSFFFFYF